MEKVLRNPNVRHFVPRLVSVDVDAVDTVHIHGVHVLLVTLHEVDHFVTHLWKIRRRPGDDIG